jgi:hypothetical protein
MLQNVVDFKWEILPLNVGRDLFLYFAQKLDCSMAPGHEEIVHISLKIILYALSIIQISSN